MFKLRKDKSCFINCEWLQRLRIQYREVLEQNRKLNEDTLILANIRSLNDAFKKTVYVGDDFYITVEITFYDNARVSNVSLEMYKLYSSLYPLGRLYTNFTYDMYGKLIKIYIQDFIVSDINKGYGTILMNEFLKYVKPIHPPKIVGILAKVDLESSTDHPSLLKHFYEKFGFEVNMDNESILLDLSTS